MFLLFTFPISMNVEITYMEHI